MYNIERNGVQIHHIDADTKNYSDDNIIVLCLDCHDRVEKRINYEKFKKIELLKYHADWERQNPIFKETVKITITPILSTPSILNYANIDSEQEIL